MSRYIRVQTHQEGEIQAPAEAVWQQLLHWGGIMTWWPKENPPGPLIEAPLRNGQTEQDLPRTRQCRFDPAALPEGFDASLLPEIIEETLLRVDPVARFLYYNMEGTGPFGMRNYLATTEVDEIAPDRTLLICRGRMDVPEGMPVEMVRGFIESVYRDGIIQGFRQTLE